VQATVRRFDVVTRSGTVLLDDGVELPYDSDAFDAGGIRLLRVGQRVRIEVEDAPTGRRVVFLTIATLPGRRTS
jgi:cold shock CspA family protein